MSGPPYFEFNDPDDPESNAYEREGRMSFKLGVEPQMYLLTMIAEPKMLAGDALVAVGQLMKAAYEQGKRVGAL